MAPISAFSLQNRYSVLFRYDKKVFLNISTSSNKSIHNCRFVLKCYRASTWLCLQSIGQWAVYEEGKVSVCCHLSVYFSRDKKKYQIDQQVKDLAKYFVLVVRWMVDWNPAATDLSRRGEMVIAGTYGDTLSRGLILYNRDNYKLAKSREIKNLWLSFKGHSDFKMNGSNQWRRITFLEWKILELNSLCHIFYFIFNFNHVWKTH